MSGSEQTAVVDFPALPDTQKGSKLLVTITSCSCWVMGFKRGSLTRLTTPGMVKVRRFPEVPFAGAQILSPGCR